MQLWSFYMNKILCFGSCSRTRETDREMMELCMKNLWVYKEQQSRLYIFQKNKTYSEIRKRLMRDETTKITSPSSVCMQPLTDTLPVYLDNPSQAEVGHLADQIFSHQDVPGSQVPVDDVSVLQVGHALRNLTPHVDEMSWCQHLAFSSWTHKFYLRVSKLYIQPLYYIIYWSWPQSIVFIALFCKLK